jgi:MipA family protein
MQKLILISAIALASSLASPATAQDGDEKTIPDVDNAFKGDYLIVAAGSIYTSDHDGSDDYRFVPAAGFRARVGDVRVFSRAIGIGADFIADDPDARVSFSLGPVVRYRGNRTGKVRDRVVRQLPRLDDTFEAGATMGISFEGLITKRDSLSFGSDVRWTVSGNKGGRVITADVSYFTPVSRAAGVGISFGMDHVNRDFADYNYSVDAAGSAASGLPVYRAHGGVKNWNARFVAGYDLDGNLRNGGWAVGGAISYARLTGSAARTPITRLRGSRSQWLAGAGLAYTF